MAVGRYGALDVLVRRGKCRQRRVNDVKVVSVLVKVVEGKDALVDRPRGRRVQNGVGTRRLPEVRRFESLHVRDGTPGDRVPPLVEGHRRRRTIIMKQKRRTEKSKSLWIDW